MSYSVYANHFLASHIFFNSVFFRVTPALIIRMFVLKVSKSYDVTILFRILDCWSMSSECICIVQGISKYSSFSGMNLRSKESLKFILLNLVCLDKYIHSLKLQQNFLRISTHLHLFKYKEVHKDVISFR